VIRVQCPHCERRYRTVTEAMGKPAVCSKCKQTFRIGESRPPFQWQQTDLCEDSWIGCKPPEEREELRHCFMCDAPMLPGDVRCPECGANQITGMVHRSRYNAATEKKTSFGAHIPWRLIITGCVVLLLALGLYSFVSSLTQSAAELGEGLADQKLVQQAVKHLRERRYDYDFATKFGGRVNDENLERFLGMLSAEDPDIRRAATYLIGHGRIKTLAPIVEHAECQNTTIREAALQILQVMGPRPLVHFGADTTSWNRQPAIKALCLLFELEPNEQTLRKLDESRSTADMILTLNELCRPRPQAVGPFRVVINNNRSSFLVEVKQIGQVFYMKVGTNEFRTLSTEHRTFEIPIEQWCTSTGPALDIAGLRQMISGFVVLQTPLGVGWNGTIRLTAKQSLPDKLPGFLPVKPPTVGNTIETTITLESP